MILLCTNSIVGDLNNARCSVDTERKIRAWRASSSCTNDLEAKYGEEIKRHFDDAVRNIVAQGRTQDSVESVLSGESLPEGTREGD